MALVLIWQAGVSLGLVPERLLSAPTTVAATGWQLLTDGTLLPATGRADFADDRFNGLVP